MGRFLCCSGDRIGRVPIQIGCCPRFVGCPVRVGCFSGASEVGSVLSGASGGVVSDWWGFGSETGLSGLAQSQFVLGVR